MDDAGTAPHDWRLEMGREVARQCPSLVVVVALCIAFLWSQERQADRVDRAMRTMTAAVQSLDAAIRLRTWPDSAWAPPPADFDGDGS